MEGLECHAEEFGHYSVSRRVLGKRMAYSELCFNSQQVKGGLEEETVHRKISEEATSELLSRSNMSLTRLTADRWKGGDDARNIKEVEATQSGQGHQEALLHSKKYKVIY